MHYQRNVSYVREDEIVEGETLGEMEFGVFLEEIDGNCEICRIGD